jgi:hypothetical protein
MQSTIAKIRKMLVWVVLPLRILLHGFRFVFGHPIPSLVVFGTLSVVLFYIGALPGPVGPEGRITAGAGNPIPGASSLAALCGLISGVLILWMSEHRGHVNSVWTKAPSIWRPLGEPIVVAPSDAE